MTETAIVNIIKVNKRRMDKLNSIPDIQSRREKARRYVVAECQAHYYRATPDEVSRMVVMLVG